MTLVVHHFGPDPATVGGMASVIRLFGEHQVGGDLVESHPTWTPHSTGTTMKLMWHATLALFKVPAGQVAHIHLSEGGAFLREGLLVALARAHGLVTVLTVHGASFLPFAADHPRLVSAVLRRADLITCLDQATLDRVRLSAPLVQSELLPNPVVVDDDPLPADATEELVVFAGEIGLRKGADVLHRAWPLVAQQRPRARCVMVGPVLDFSASPAERLEVRTPVGPTEMRGMLRRARVVALPARAEALPMVLVEAMGAGRPFVSTDVGGIAELAEHGGMLVAVGDEVALADRLIELLGDPGLARDMGERGRRFCLQTRSPDVIDARLRTLYSRAAMRKATG